jgi:7-cyano-7-deazaguanine synthase
MLMNKYLLSYYPNYDKTQIHALNSEIAYVMLSGGLDSTTALWWALDNYKEVKAFIVNYNQQHSIELEYAKNISEITGVNYEFINISFPNSFWGIENKLTRGQACLMTSIAALDISNNGADIVHGILQTDDYGDCNRDFLDELASVLFHPNDRNKIGIATPLRAFDNKASVIAYAYQIGAPISKTWTCRSPFKNKPCGECIQCKQRENAFIEFSDKYNVGYCEALQWLDVYGSPYHPILNNEIDDKIKTTINFFIENNGVKRGIPVLLYNAPDGTIRIATHIHKLPRKYNKHSMKIVNMLSVHGYFEDGYRWELCISKNCDIAATSRLPDVGVIEDLLLKNVEI